MRVIGVGNPWRRDDGAGPEVARRLARAGVDAVEFDKDGAGLMELWKAEHHVILVDASRSGASAGTTRHFDARKTKLPRDQLFYSSHAFGVGEAIETARILGTLPERLLVIAIEGADFSAGSGLSAPVAAAVDQTVQDILKNPFALA